MAKFMGQVRGGKVTFDPDRVVMSGGATGAQDTLAFCLADPGDAYLVPTPYYPAYVLIDVSSFIFSTKVLSCPSHPLDSTRKLVKCTEKLS